jgi:hypothetical protein
MNHPDRNEDVRLVTDRPVPNEPRLTRIAAARAAEKAAEWLRNGGPDGYDIQEALSWLETAEECALAALAKSGREVSSR